MPILLTAFEPFDETGLNSSQEGCAAFIRSFGPRWDIRYVLLPVRYGTDTEAVQAALRDFEPEIVLHTGQTGQAAAIQVERIAVNVRYPEDTHPFLLPQQAIEPDGPAGLFSTLPVDAVADAIRAAGVPAAVSNHAGVYLCNHVLYQSLRCAEGTTRRVGFLHIPRLPEQAPEGRPSMRAEQVAAAINAALECLKP